MSKTLTLKMHASVTGYADDQLRPTFESGVKVDKPFVLLAGPNGSGKSAVLRGIRSTIGLTGERFGSAAEVLGVRGTEYAIKDTDKKQSGSIDHHESPSAVFDLEAMGWTGQPCYLFDSRAASGMASKSSFDDDMLYHVNLIAGGGSKVSHGQFVAKTWREAIKWACGAPDDAQNKKDWSKEREDLVTQLSKNKPSEERWLLLDEPEGAIDIEQLLTGLAGVLHVAEVGKLRVFCSSHSLLFAAGIAEHPKIQVINLKNREDANWINIQKRAMKFAADADWIARVGEDVARNISK